MYRLSPILEEDEWEVLAVKRRERAVRFICCGYFLLGIAFGAMFYKFL